MVLVKIDIKNIASETHPDDKVVFRSPVVREAVGGGLVSTADEVVSLVDGVGELELVPGPVIVTFQCRGMADTRPKRGTVPDSGPVTVADVIGQNFTFTPEVVGAAQAARNQAVQAASDAEAAEEAAGGHAEAAGNSANAASDYAQEAKGYRDTASGHAQTATDQAGVATDKAGEADASANTAGDHAVAADTAWQGAVAAQGLAETARDEAETKVQTALDAALPTKADAEHTHTTEQVTGLDAALASKAAQTTLDTRVPENLALRVDTTVGTRVFAGSTMIYGDTGLRALVLWDTIGNITYGTMPTGIGTVSGMAGGIWIRRIRENVTLSITGAVATSASSIIDIPSRFPPNSSPYPTVSFRVSSGTGWASIGSGKAYLNCPAGDSIPSRSSSAYSAMLTWNTNEPWPISLPGLPA